MLNVHSALQRKRNRPMPYSDYLRRRVLVHHSRGLSTRATADALSDEGLRATRQGIVKFLRRVQETGSLERQPGSGRPSSMTLQMLGHVEEQMRRDDGTMAQQLLMLLHRHGYKAAAIPRWDGHLEAVLTAEVQMIREANKAKWVDFARRYVPPRGRERLH